MPIQETLGEIAKRYRQSPAAVKVGSVLLPVAVIIPGCGGSSSELSDCPSPEYYRDHAPVPAKIFKSFQVSINALRARITAPDESKAATGQSTAETIDPRYAEAAETIFRTKKDSSGDELLVDSSETKLDDKGEVLCEGNGGELFLSGEAELAAAELYSAGIDVMGGPAQADPSR